MIPRTGTRTRIALFSILAMMLFDAEVIRAEYDPFLIPRDKFRTEIKRVAIRPFRFSSDVPNADFLSRLVIHHIANKVEDAGLLVVDPPAFESRWLEYSELLGGVYDVRTGKLDEEKDAIVFEYAMRDLAAEFEIDAVIRPTVFMRASGTHWRSGYLESSGSRLKWKGFPVRHTDRFTYWPQSVLSAFLGFEIRNIAGQVIYDVGCPIEWATIYMSREFEERDLDEVYTNVSIDRSTTACVEDLAKLASDSPGE